MSAKTIGLALLLAIFCLSSFAIAKPTMKTITSKQNVKQALSETRAPESEIPGVLKVHSLGIGLGQTFLYGDFDSNGEDSITLDAYYTYAASYSFDMIANVHYSSHSFRDYSSSIPGVTLGIKSKLYHIDSFVPFALGGFGFYLPSLKRQYQGGIQKTDKKLTFGYHFGVGCDLALNKRFAIGALAHYHNPFDIKQENGKEVEGAYIKLLMTTRYTF